MSEHELWNELGNLYFMSGTYKQAAYAYNRSIQLDAGFGRPYCNLALTYVKQGRYEEAVQLYQCSIELLVDQTEKAITWYRLGDVYRHLKNYRDAIMAYQQADLLEPGLSQESKESDEILYGGSGENLPAGSPEMQARAEETEAAVQAEEAAIEPAPLTVTETPVIAASPVLASITSTALLEPASLTAAITEMEALKPQASHEEPVIETVAVLEITEPEPDIEVSAAPEAFEAAAEEPIENEPVEAETVEPQPIELEALEETSVALDEIDIPEVIEVAEAVAEPVVEAAEPEEQIQEVLAEATEIVEPEAELEVIETAEETESISVEETQPIEVEPEVKIEIVFDREEPMPLEAPEMVDEEPETRTETVAMPEMHDLPTETLSMSEVPAPAAETISNAADPDTAWIDDDYLVSNFDHETEVYLPDFEEDQFNNWLPIEPEPAYLPGESEDPWSLDNRMQLAVQTSVQNARRLPGHMLRESWEPALPLADADLELPIAEESLEDVFIVPQETIEPEAVIVSEPEAEAEVETPIEAVASEPDPLQTAEELQLIEKEITRFKYVVQSNPRNAAAWDTLGTLYKSARRYREAIMAYQQAVAVDGSKAPYHHHLGILYAIEGREEDAMRAFQEVIEIDPNHGLANATLGGYYRKLGLEELAQRHIGKAMKNFYNSENEYNKACLEALCGNVEQSIELLKIALKNKQTYVDWVLRDPDLDSIRRDPRFKLLIADYLA